MKVSEYTKSRQLQRDDVTTAIEEHCPGQSTSPNANLSAAAIGRLDEFFGRAEPQTPNVPDANRADPGEQPPVQTSPHPSEQPAAPAAPAAPLVHKLPEGVRPFGVPDGGRKLWRVEFKGSDAAFAFAYGHDESEAVANSLAGLRRVASSSRYAVERAEA